MKNIHHLPLFPQFNIAKILTISGLLMVLFLGKTHAQVPENWTVNPASFDYSMTVVGVVKLGKIEQLDDNARVAAFINGECRGVVKPVYEPATERLIFYLLVYSSKAGENVEFKIYQSQENKVYSAVDGLSFAVDGLVGEAEKPYVWSNVALSKSADLLTYSLEGQFGEAQIGTGTVSVAFAPNADLTQQVATFTLSEGATAWVGTKKQESGTTPNDFSQIVTYTIHSEDGQTFKTYQVQTGLVLALGDRGEPTEQLWMYPNPASDQVQLQIPVSAKAMYVLSASGQLLLARQKSEWGNDFQQIINLSNFPSGLYFVKVVDGNQSLTQKLEVVR